MKNEFQVKVQESLLISAKDYFSLISKIIILESEEFEAKKRLVLKFTGTNFIHLTGLSTKLSAAEFFCKCLNSSIVFDDYYIDPKKKSAIKNKLKNLMDLSTIFNNEILVQENFVKNTISCTIATSDNKRTLGFIDGHYCLYPKTLLDKNHLDINKKIIRVKPIIISEY